MIHEKKKKKKEREKWKEQYLLYGLSITGSWLFWLYIAREQIWSLYMLRNHFEYQDPPFPLSEMLLALRLQTKENINDI
jgi:hypothetical protein